MKLLPLLTLLLLSLHLNAKEPDKNSANKTISLSGQIVDMKSGEPLVGVAVKVGEKTTYSDFDGNYEFIDLKSDDYTIETSYIAYKQQKIKINIKTNKACNIALTSE